MEKGLWKKSGETIQGVSKERKVVLVELAPGGGGLKVGREMYYI